MAVGAFGPLAVFVLIAGGVGFRLTRLWWRTSGVPEGSLGVGLLMLTLSIPLTAVGRVPQIAMQPIGRLSFGTGLVAAAVGLCLMSYFNREVFRRDEAWAAALIVVTWASLLGSVLYMSAANFVGEDVHAIKLAMRPGTVTLMTTVMACFAWAGVESFLSYAAARRRLALGLSDRMAVNRFLLWGLSNLACSLQVAALVGCVLAGMVIMREPVPLAILAACGIVMSVCWYFTFFTPARYRRLVEGRTGG